MGKIKDKEQFSLCYFQNSYKEAIKQCFTIQRANNEYIAFLI